MISRSLAGIVRVGVLAILALVLSLTALTAASRNGAAEAGWQHIQAVRTDSHESLNIDLWLRDADAVLIERRGERIVMDRRCEQGLLSEHWSQGRVVRQMADTSECFDLATDSLLGFVRAAVGPDFQLVTADDAPVASGLTYESKSPLSDVLTVAVDAGRTVPLRVKFRSGDVWSWEYPSTTDATRTPPALDDVPSVPTEVYTDLQPSEAATSLGLATVPSLLAGLNLDATFSYRPADGPETTYAVWRSEAGVEVQLAITQHKPQAGELGIEDFDGTIVLRLEEGGALVQISAPSWSILKEAVSVLRPGVDLAALEATRSN